MHFEQDTDDPAADMLRGTSRVPLSDFLAEHDIVVNCVLQDTDTPLMFLTSANWLVPAWQPDRGRVLRRGHGLQLGAPNRFAEPMVAVGNNVHYYAVDHSPSHRWNSATWEISEALLPHLLPVLTGPEAWEANETIQRAVEIRDGVIRNPRILSFHTVHRTIRTPTNANQGPHDRAWPRRRPRPGRGVARRRSVSRLGPGT